MKNVKKLLSLIVCALIIVSAFVMPLSVAAETVTVTEVESLISALGKAELSNEFLTKLENAEKAYASLSNEQKQQVSNANTLKDAREKYDALRYDQAGWYYPKTFDFNEGTKISDYATMSSGTNKLSGSSIENKALKVVSAGDGGTMLFDVYSNIETYSFDVKLASNNSMHFCYYNDSVNGNYSALMICNDGTNININPVRYSDNYFVNLKTVSWNKNLTADKWFTIKLTYGTEYKKGVYAQHYSPGTVMTKHITNITVTDTATGELIKSRDISAANQIRAFAYGVDRNIIGNENATEPEKAQVGFRAYGHATTYVDNLTVTYRNKENAESYKIRYEDILSKKVSDISEADRAIYDEALDVFFSLEDSQKKLLKKEMATMLSFAQVLYPDLYVAADEYISEYYALLNKTLYYSSDLPKLKEAYDAFYRLDEKVQQMVDCPYGMNLRAALQQISDKPTPRDEDDLSALNFDFEYLQNPLELEREPAEEYRGSIVKDPTNSNNHVFAMQGTDLFYLIKDEYLPSVEGLQVSEFSLRFYTEAVNNVTSPLFAYAFEDPENFHATTFSSFPSSNNAMPFEYASMSEEQFSRKHLQTYSEIAFGKWAELTYSFGDTTCTVTLKVGKDPVSYNIDYASGLQVALGFAAEYGHKSEVAYIDDISLKFDVRDYDKNERTHDINVYYQGNTFQKPDETVLLNGASLYKNVKDAELYVLDDTGIDVTNPQYVFEKNFDSSKVDEGITTAPTTPNLSSGTDIEFVQKTGTSLKFILPKSDDKHIYAVKLNPSYLDAASEIVYINNPVIDFVMGDDGDDATKDGTLRIIGKNLYVDDAHTVSVVLKSLTDGSTVQLTDLEFIKGDAYSVEAKLPSDFKAGEYEVYVHNGYGDNTCWSEPKLCSVKEKAENEIWSSKGLFNVKDYGAVGDVTTNDTGAIIAALEAAYKNGGGTVYFPRGQYRVISTLAIPRNVTIEGESQDNTMIFWDSHHWDYNEVPPLTTITGNVEFKNIYLYATRNAKVVAMQCDIPIREYEYLFGDPTTEYFDNVYIDNVTFWGAFEAGNPSIGGNAWKFTEELSYAEMAAITTKEALTHKIELHAGGKNYQVSNFYCQLSRSPGYVQALDINGRYVRVENTKLPTISFNGIVRKLIAENNDFEGRSVGVNGSDMYLARNKFGYIDSNNREGYVSDGVPRYRTERVQKIDDGGKNITFKMVSRSKFEWNQFAGMEIYVVSGQGLGQCRTIVSSETDGTFTVNEPFIISPNRNSTVTVFEPRARIKFIQNTFEECSTNGPYGVHVDGIWDGNVYSHSQGQYFCPNMVFEWYITLLNQVFKDPLYIHGEGIGAQYGGTMTDNQIFIWTNTAPRPNSFIGMTIKENDMDGHNIHIKSSVTNCINDVIIEKNKIYNVKEAIYCENVATVLDGLYIRNNDIEASVFDYDSKIVSSGVNHCGYKRAIIVNLGTTDLLLLGDVNLDGEITLKDCSLITYYYLEMVTLNAEQLLRADVNSDGKHNLKDATRIKQHILYGIELGKISSNEGYYPGHW